MNLIDSIRDSAKLRNYWESLLGKELLKKVLDSPETYDFQENQSTQTSRNEEIDLIASEYQSFLKGEGFFSPFFDFITNYILKKLNTKLNELNTSNTFNAFNTSSAIEDDLPDSHIRESLVKQMGERLSWTCIRCLINEMHGLKENGQLKGSDSTEEYQDYLERYLKSPEYVRNFFNQYPVIAELVITKTKDFVQYTGELMSHFRKDKEEIVRVLCEGRSFEKITEIKIGLSDEHFAGKTVAKLCLDNGTVIYHKPHDLSFAVFYNEMHQWLLERCGLDSYSYKILNREAEGYGWEAEVSHQGCSFPAEIEEYYQRVGIQLSLSYVLGITDIHFENMVSHGCYPVIIDLEFFGDRRLKVKEKPECMNDLLMDTVMNTGILPVNVWCGQNINMGGLGESGEQRSPVQMPVVVNKGTSDMAIAYEYPKINAAQNLPELNGEKVEFRSYIPNIISGFEEGYRVIFNGREDFKARFGHVFHRKSRFILRNTQEYFMYQNSLNFPAFMADGSSRRLMLAHMDKGLRCEPESRSEILKYEMASVYHSVIPVFYAEGRNLRFGNGYLVKDYFTSDGREQVMRKLDKLSEKDMELQIRVIEADFLSYGKTDRKWNGRFRDTIRLSELNPVKIADLINANACVFEDGIHWTDIQYNNFGKTFLGPADLYLYSGLCGMAVFYTALCRRYPEEKYKNTQRQVIRQLFAHTEELQKKGTKANAWGLLTGEASFVYTYLILYKITGEENFINYAREHCGYLLEHLGDSCGDDLLEGRAGIVIALVKMYEATQDSHYLDAAGVMASRLEMSAVTMSGGIGWPRDGNLPLGGMAHGCSGIALAFAFLWRYTKKAHYLEIIRKALSYEDTLYSAKCHNWLDVRNQAMQNHSNDESVKGQDMVAWCHGAAGIFAARLRIHVLTDLSLEELFQIAGRRPDEALRVVIDKIAASVKNDMCLCHGNAGLQMILDYWERLSNREAVDGIRACCRKNSAGCLSLEDMDNPGFMMGLSGLGYGMLMEEDRDLPNILCLE